MTFTDTWEGTVDIAAVTRCGWALGRMHGNELGGRTVDIIWGGSGKSTNHPAPTAQASRTKRPKATVDPYYL